MDLHLTLDTNGAWLDWGAGPRRAAIGPGGIAIKQQEGDGVTPRGGFPIREVLYRADKGPPLATALPLRAITPDDGWCDAPDDPQYNRQVKLPYPASAEHLWRDDDVYDVIAVVGFNDDPVVPGKGSAIFLHHARPDFSPTAGCVALAPSDLRQALEQLSAGDRLIVD
jgi:L,D-peptidoglycan transpeptidase YkuD (ErfK/YbiS/YcfS/YnhG family)